MEETSANAEKKSRPRFYLLLFVTENCITNKQIDRFDVYRLTKCLNDTLFLTVCGAQLHSSANKRQFVSHPSYGDDNYKSNLHCRWQLKARSGYIVRLRFKEFDAENEKLCGYDYVIVRDGNNSTAPLLGRVCGQGSPGSSREFVSSGNQMWIQFKTDLTNNKKGFIAEYFRSRKTDRSSL